MKRIATMALGIGIGALVLTGCGGGASSGGPSETKADRFAKSIEGAWLFENANGCRNHNGESSYRKIIFNDKNMILDYKDYSELNCTEDALDKWATVTYGYTIDTNITGKTFDGTTMYALDLAVKEKSFHKGTFTGAFVTANNFYGAIGKERQKLILSWDFVPNKVDRDKAFKDDIKKIHNDKMAQYIKEER